MAPGAAPFYRPDRGLARIGRAALAAACEAGEMAPGRIALTLVAGSGDRASGFAHRGAAPLYPASVAKLFLLAAAAEALEEGRRPAADLERALAAMIRRSSNDATAYVVDWLTGTTGGPELGPAALRRWIERRQAIDRRLAGWGWPELAGCRLWQKTWEDGPYGRERQGREAPGSRNSLTSDAATRLLWAIGRGAIASPARSAAMLDLLARDPGGREPAENQTAGFLGEGLPPGARLWSKAGWTSETRHDAALIELPGGRRFVLAVFTEGTAAAANDRLLPRIARRVAAGIAGARDVS